MRNWLCVINFMLFWGMNNADCNSKWPKCKPDRGINTVCLRKENCGGLGNCKDLGNWQDFRQWMTEFHNELRNNVAIGNDTRGGNGEASNMNAISYDLDLEYVAQCHINKCDFNHDKCRLTLKFPSHVGQNLYTGTYKLDNKAGVRRSVQNWYDEIKDVTAEAIDSYQTGAAMIGHYTQLVWAATTHIGCGISKEKNKYYVACNYGVGGNMLGAKVYERGTPCSKCSPGVKCNGKYKGLCGEITVATGNKQAQLKFGLFIATLLIVVLVQ